MFRFRCGFREKKPVIFILLRIGFATFFFLNSYVIHGVISTKQFSVDSL